MNLNEGQFGEERIDGVLEYSDTIDVSDGNEVLSENERLNKVIERRQTRLANLQFRVYDGTVESLTVLSELEKLRQDNEHDLRVFELSEKKLSDDTGFWNKEQEVLKDIGLRANENIRTDRLKKLREKIISEGLLREEVSPLLEDIAEKNRAQLEELGIIRGDESTQEISENERSLIKEINQLSIKNRALHGTQNIDLEVATAVTSDTTKKASLWKRFKGLFSK